jgi:hypothetical protein
MKKLNRKTEDVKKLAPERMTSSLERARTLGLWGIVGAWENFVTVPRETLWRLKSHSKGKD